MQLNPEKVNSSIGLSAYVSKNETSKKLDEILKKFGTDKNYMYRFFNDPNFGYKELTNKGLQDSEKIYPGIVEGLKILLNESGNTNTFEGRWENSNYKRNKQGIKIGRGIILLGLLTGLSLGVLVYYSSKALSKNQESN